METNDKTTPITPEKDRNTISMDLMHRMRLHGMAVAFTSANRFKRPCFQMKQLLWHKK